MESQEGFDMIAPSALRSLIDTRPPSDYDIIDVRQPSEYEENHIPGAKLIPIGDLETRLDELRPDREQIFYCAAGVRSKRAASLAARSGRFKKPVRTLDGGLRAWSGAKVPDYPPLRAFEDAETFRDTLISALELEKGSWLFYRGLLADPPQQLPCSTIQELADAKRTQARRIYDFLARSVGSNERLKPFEELFDSLKGNILESGDSVATLLEWAKTSYTDCRNLAELALDLEYEAYDLYRNMAFDADDKAESEAFEALSSEEHRLINHLLDQLDSFHKPEQH